MSLIGSTSFSFAQNMMQDFQNTILNSQWQRLQQMPQEWDSKLVICFLVIKTWDGMEKS